MADVNQAIAELYGSSSPAPMVEEKKDRRMTQHSRKWSSSGLGLDAAEAEARRLEKKGTFSATMDEEAGTVTLSKDDFKAVMGKLGGHKKTAKRSQANMVMLAFGYLAVSIGFIAVIVGLMNWRLEASKESHVKGSEMTGKDGNAVMTATLLNYASIYDLAKLDVRTLVKTKEVSLTLTNDNTLAFEITGATKRAGSKIVTLQTPGGTVTINGEVNTATATINGVCHKVKEPTEEQARRLAVDSVTFHSSADFFATSSVSGRSLSQTSAGGYAASAVASGKVGTEQKDGNDVLSGLVTLLNPSDSSASFIRFSVNGRTVKGNGFNDMCDSTTDEVTVNEPGRVTVVLSSNRDNKITFFNELIGAKGSFLANGSFAAESCFKARDVLGDEVLDAISAMKSGPAVTTAEGDTMKDAFEIVYGPQGDVSEAVKDQKFQVVLSKASEEAIADACGRMSHTARRLGEDNLVEQAAHFDAHYFQPLMSHDRRLLEEDKTEEHKGMVEAAHVIQEMFESEKRRLAGDASTTANDAYNNHGSGSKCESSNAYAFVSKRSGTCYVAFRGSNAPTSWSGLKDWFDNFNIGTTTMGGRNIHAGFANYYNKVSGCLGGKISSVCGGSSVVYTGHSLGAAAATVAKLDRADGGIVTFAGPAIFKNGHQPSWSGSRLWNNWDGVPNVLSKSIMGSYRHGFGSHMLEEHCSTSCGWRGCSKSCRWSVTGKGANDYEDWTYKYGWTGTYHSMDKHAQHGPF
jgi:hypothetical protein